MLFIASQCPYVILCPFLNDGCKLAKGRYHIKWNYKELIRTIMTFGYEYLLLKKSPQKNVASNIAITEKHKQARHIIYARGIMR